jgi:hypothetical protein
LLLATRRKLTAWPLQTKQEVRQHYGRFAVPAMKTMGGLTIVIVRRESSIAKSATTSFAHRCALTAPSRFLRRALAVRAGFVAAAG